VHRPDALTSGSKGGVRITVPLNFGLFDRSVAPLVPKSNCESHPHPSACVVSINRDLPTLWC
jgi:hypothetical protein